MFEVSDRQLDESEYTIKSTIGKLIILRGIPGCGKTSFAGFLVNNIYEAEIYAADDYWEKEGGYEFDLSKLHLAHKECQKNVKGAMEDEVPVIIIHNTSTQNKELEPYLCLAKTYGYEVSVLVVENRHNGKDMHNVPEETLQRMTERLRGSIQLRGEPS